MLLSSSSTDHDQSDDILDLNGDAGWDLGHSGDNLHAGNSAPSGGSSKPMTEEEQRISVALQVNIFIVYRNSFYLKERIAINVKRLGNHALNTTEIAKECKRIMTAYNIGQRLFARFVMNQVVKVSI
jgi:hypothetical protein